MGTLVQVRPSPFAQKLYLRTPPVRSSGRAGHIQPDTWVLFTSAPGKRVLFATSLVLASVVNYYSHRRTGICHHLKGVNPLAQTIALANLIMVAAAAAPPQRPIPPLSP